MNQNNPHKEDFLKDVPSSDEIDIGKFLRSFYRRKYFIFSFTSIVTFSAFIFSSTRTSIYKGGFEIVVVDKQGSSSTNNEILSNLKINPFSNKSNDNLTQQFILKSPSVLMPVYNSAKQKYEERGINTQNLSFRKWVQKKLLIEFSEGTNVLKVDFEDPEKTFIIETLTSISNKYKEYSSQERRRLLTNTIKYLNTQQKKLKDISTKSTKELNEFSIENGLGDIDGFVSLGARSTTTNKINLEDLQESNILPKLDSLKTNNTEKAGQRYSQQFQLLEGYEAQYVDLSSKLKPNSETLRNLNKKIENLRSSLKRPNEILLKYRELVKKAKRNENLLNKIEDQIIINELEIAKQPEFWELISTPTIYKNKVYPRIKSFTASAFISSTILGLFLAILLDKRKGLIYEFNDLKIKIKCNYIDTIFLKNSSISLDILKKYFKENNEASSKVTLVDVSNFMKEDYSILDSLKKEISNSFKIIDFKNKEELMNSQKLVFLVQSGKLQNKDLILLNQYAKILDEKIMGWFYLDQLTLI